MTNFTDSINITAALLQEVESGSVGLQEARAKLCQLLISVDTARGFFVSLLTGDNDAAEHPAQWLLDSFSSSEQIVSELLAKNLVMSTAMKLTHHRSGNLKEAEGSQLVARRVSTLIGQWHSPRLKLELASMLASIKSSLGEPETQNGHYLDFLSRWSYDPEQLAAAKLAIEALDQA